MLDHKLDCDVPMRCCIPVNRGQLPSCLLLALYASHIADTWPPSVKQPADAMKRIALCPIQNSSPAFLAIVLWEEAVGDKD